MKPETAKWLRRWSVPSLTLTAAGILVALFGQLHHHNDVPKIHAENALAVHNMGQNNNANNISISIPIGSKSDLAGAVAGVGSESKLAKPRGRRIVPTVSSGPAPVVIPESHRTSGGSLSPVYVGSVKSEGQTGGVTAAYVESVNQ